MAIDTTTATMMIFWFVGLSVAAVGKTAAEVVKEVRRQFR